MKELIKSKIEFREVSLNIIFSYISCEAKVGNNIFFNIFILKFILGFCASVINIA